MYYRIDKDALYGLVFAEVSRVADEAYAEDGTPLYDQVVLTEKDRGAMEALLADALSHFVASCWDIAAYRKLTAQATAADKTVRNAGYDIGEHFDAGTGSAETAHVLDIDVPDFDMTQQYAATEQITRYVTLAACAALFRQRRPALVQEYADRADAALGKAVALLRKRTKPTRS